MGSSVNFNKKWEIIFQKAQKINSRTFKANRSSKIIRLVENFKDLARITQRLRALQNLKKWKLSCVKLERSPIVVHNPSSDWNSEVAQKAVNTFI